MDPAREQGLDPADLVGLLVDAEWTARENRRLTDRLRHAEFPQQATVEAIDYYHSRSLQKHKMLDLVPAPGSPSDRTHPTIITSQLDPTHWHSFIGDETVADAIFDRHLKLHGECLCTRSGG